MGRRECYPIICSSPKYNKHQSWGHYHHSGPRVLASAVDVINITECALSLSPYILTRTYVSFWHVKPICVVNFLTKTTL